MEGGASARRGPTTAAVGTALAILHAQHGELRDLLRQVDAASGVDRQGRFDALRELLAVHETAEELVLRSPESTSASRAVTAARNGEERQLAELLADLERLDVDSAEFAGGFAKFAEALTAHVWLEEAEEFPALQARWSEERQEWLGSWLRRAFELGSTHAHPLVAGSPVAQRTVGPFAALLDRARDSFAETRDEPPHDPGSGQAPSPDGTNGTWGLER